MQTGPLSDMPGSATERDSLVAQLTRLRERLAVAERERDVALMALGRERWEDRRNLAGGIRIGMDAAEIVMLAGRKAAGLEG